MKDSGLRATGCYCSWLIQEDEGVGLEADLLELQLKVKRLWETDESAALH